MQSLILNRAMRAACWAPVAVTAQYTTKGMKGPHKNVDNPGPRRPHSIPEWSSPFIPVRCIVSINRQQRERAALEAWRGPQCQAACAPLRLGLNVQDAVWRTQTDKQKKKPRDWSQTLKETSQAVRHSRTREREKNQRAREALSAVSGDEANTGARPTH